MVKIFAQQPAMRAIASTCLVGEVQVFSVGWPSVQPVATADGLDSAVRPDHSLGELPCTR